MKQPLLGKQVSEIRNKKGMTQKELADACHVDIRTIQRIEAGDVLPRMFTLRLLINSLGVDISAIISPEKNEKIESTNEIKVAFFGGIIFSVNYLLVAIHIISNSTNTFIYPALITIYIVSCIFFFKGFYFLAKQWGNQVLAASALLSIILLPLLNIMALFKTHYFGLAIINVYTAVCINGIILGIGFLLEVKKSAFANLYKVAGVISIIQSVLFLSASSRLINMGLIISMVCNFICVLILYQENRNLKPRFASDKVNALLG